MATRFRKFGFGLSVLVLTPWLWAQNSEQIRLVGVGSTVPLRAYSLWIREFAIVRPDIQTSYLPFGSSRGIELVVAGRADFGGTDTPQTPAGLEDRNLLFLPVALGAIVPIYNLPGSARSLRFTPQALAGIYLGRITRWDDVALTAANPGVALPSTEIAVIHSAEGRGSTFIWSDYLSKVSPEWRAKVGRGTALHWPVGTEADGSGNVAKAVQETPNSIGFVEHAYAVQYQLSHGDVQNAAGRFVEANEESTSAAAHAALKNMLVNFRGSITDAAGAASYPIASYTWFVIPANNSLGQKQRGAKDFLRWILSEGQNDLKATGLVRIPPELVVKELQVIEKMP